MARLILEGFPAAPVEGEWCAACAALAKGTLLAPKMEHIEARLADAGREAFTVRVDPKEAARMLRRAVAHGPAMMLGGAVVPLCWEHLPAVDGNAPAPRAGGGAPGLIVPPQGRGR